MKIDRRQFMDLLAQAGVIVASIKVVACAPIGQHSKTHDDGDTAGSSSSPQMVTIYDIKMEGWSVLGSGLLGMLPTPLKAQTIADHVEVTLPYTQDNHGHKFTLTKELLLKLRHGEKVEVLTTEAQGHHHKVVIDPLRRKIPGTEMLVPYDPEGTSSVSPQSDLFAGIDANERPKLYVASNGELAEDSVEFCLAAPADCDSNATLWQRLNATNVPSGKKVFSAQDGLSIFETQDKWDLSIKAKLKGSQSPIMRRLQLMKKNLGIP